MSERHPLWGQLPEPIQHLLDNEDSEGVEDWAAPYVTEYAYDTTHPQTGEPFGISLGFEYEYEPDPLPEVGDLITLNGIQVEVTRAEESSEQVEGPDFTGTLTWRGVTVRGPEE